MKCQECGSEIPKELIEIYNNGTSIYCEKCGKELIKKDANGKSPPSSVIFKKRISFATKQLKKKTAVFGDKVKQKIKELKDRYEKD